jgi:glucose-6-phosphate dehydrogenase assembly protein OpcA
VEETLTAAPTEVEGWAGHDVRIAEIERAIARLRQASAAKTEGPDLRTSVMTHMAWVPGEWVQAAYETLEGLAERHPSRTIVLIPEPDASSGLDAEVSLRCFPLQESHGHVCTEVIELRLRGDRTRAPASIVTPLLISDLPAFLRWRGQPAFDGPEFEQLVDVVDRLIVDSAEWPDLPRAYSRLAEVFERAAVSDIAWGRGLFWRLELALLWPEIAELRELRVVGPHADALLLAGWLSARLDRTIELAHESSPAIEEIAVDGEPVSHPPGEGRSASDLLSDELDRFSRDPVYEEAARAATALGVPA